MTVAKQVFAPAPPIINCDFHNVRIEKNAPVLVYENSAELILRKVCGTGNEG
jgi:hypothetical protein